MEFNSYVALGDSQTEGLNDVDANGGFRGWADRLAEQLAHDNPDLRYANLAVRGKRAAEVRDEQLATAIDLQADLYTVVAGMNDLIRPAFDLGATIAHLEAMYEALAATGATVVTCTFPDIGEIVPLVRRLSPRVFALNAEIRKAAERQGVIVVDCEPHRAICDPRYWSEDRLHASPLGHAGIAAAFADTLKVTGSSSDWTIPLPNKPILNRRARIVTEARWAATFLAPWILRRLRGISSGDGITAKRPLLTPVFTN